MKRSRHISLEVAEDEPLAKRQKTAHILELAAQNKITSKNSWQLDLLERFEQVIEELTENDKFEHAACALDAGVQIFKHRVDSVHEQAYKVMNTLGRIDTTDECEEDENGEQPAEEQQDESSSAKKYKTVASSTAWLDKALPAQLPSARLYHHQGTLLLDQYCLSSDAHICLDLDNYLMSGVSCSATAIQQQNDVDTTMESDDTTIVVNAEYAHELYRSDDEIFQSMFEHGNDCDEEEQEYEDDGAPIISGFDDDDEMLQHTESNAVDEEMLSQEASQCLLHQSTQETNSITESPPRPITNFFETEVFSPPAPVKQLKKKRQQKAKRKLRFSYPSRKRQKRNDGTAKSIIGHTEPITTASSTDEHVQDDTVDDEDRGAPIFFGGNDDEDDVAAEEQQPLQEPNVCTHDALSLKQRIWQNICHQLPECNFSNVVIPSLSIASNFVGLLHLANENDLMLQSAQNHVDVQVHRTTETIQ